MNSVKWTYFYSENLNQKMAYHIEKGIIYSEDKIFYSRKELDILQEAGQQVNKSIHKVKSIFDGEIVKINTVA